MLPNAVCGAPRCYKIRFRPGLCPGPAKGAHSTPPEILAALRKPTCEGREHRGKRKKQKERMEQQVKVRMEGV